MAKQTREECIRYWYNLIWSDPDYYLGTGSYSDEDIRERAVFLADCSEMKTSSKEEAETDDEANYNTT